MGGYAERAELRRIVIPTGGELPLAGSKLTGYGNCVRKAADEGPITSATLQNDDELTRPVAASKAYRLIGYLDATNAGAVGGIQVAITIPAGATMSVGFQAGATAGVLTTSGTAGVAVAIPAGARVPVLLTGSVNSGATAGNVTIQWAEGTIDLVNGTIVKAGSILEIVEIG